ncbi:Uncharacterised protein [Salmonella enterica]|uniref:Uncharacterized protein n=1 Tax=Salmonella enterica TaxID=28901 RepID=A0A379SEF1_SALER|nr:Uncharacterised protein [Salmonella enterica]
MRIVMPAEVWTICKGLTHVDGNPVRKAWF